MKRRDFLINSAMLLCASSLLDGCINQDDIIPGGKGKVSRRKFKDITLPLLGLGCLRFEYKNGVIDEDIFAPIVHYCMEHGVNYFDTGYFYGKKKSEEVLCRALKNYKREDYYIASKIKPMFVKSKKHLKERVEVQLKRLNTDYIDFYLAHDIRSDETMAEFEKANMYEALCELRQEGKIKYIGYSCHGDIETHKIFTKKYKWDLCYLKVNYYEQTEIEKQKERLELLQKRNIPIIVMEPLYGGRLAKLEDEAYKILKDDYPNMTPVEFALRWSASQKVTALLSGMRTLEDAKENIGYFINFKKFTDPKQTAKKISKIIEKNYIVNCTACGYCLNTCEHNVDIINIFNTYNQYTLKNNEKNFTELFKILQANKKKSTCNNCRLCYRVCPQTIHIPETIDRIYREVEQRSGRKFLT